MLRRFVGRTVNAAGDRTRAFSPPIESFRSSSSASHRFGIVAANSTSADVIGEDLFLEQAPPSTIASIPSLLQPRVVVYDGVCPLCHTGVKWVIRADKYKKIKFCCVQSKAAEPYMSACGVDREDVLRRFIFIEGLGVYHQGSTAALRVFSYLPFPYSTMSSMMIVPRPLRDAAYDYVAKRRYKWFGREKECMVLREQDLLDRFIDRDEILEKSRKKL
ncbi:uncharacterized protein YuxK [Impatiens glandulifera]|uniref:uncharacterized protein YuxK n=1 Tax=Impatiens glandulifera TaxID=253017 RepID=UPI001FB0C7EC|nr:uncharacterized protein YuxK [Impatiens glandulifera]